jgi:hypothetical protein
VNARGRAIFGAARSPRSHAKARPLSSRNRVAFVCIAVPALVELGLGVAYFTASEVMSYHKEALGVGWTQLEPGVRTLLITLLNGYGSAHFAVGIALAALLLFPLRQGQAWARWAVLAIGLPVLGATAYLSARLRMSRGRGRSSSCCFCSWVSHSSTREWAPNPSMHRTPNSRLLRLLAAGDL